MPATAELVSPKANGLSVEWVPTPYGVRPAIYDPNKDFKCWATWTAQPGSQTAFLECPVFETLYEGTRGPGKTDALIMDFAQHVGEDLRTPEQVSLGVPQKAGWGSEWRGVLFRRTYPELEDVINKSLRWFGEIFPEAVYNSSKSFWRWPTGEKLYFRFITNTNDYYKYHGHAYPWMAFEELTTWHDPGCYTMMFSCCRSTVPGIPKKIRATTNPYGVGHNWVKRRWRLPVPPNRIFGDLVEDPGEPPRIAIHGDIRENIMLLSADPSYIRNIRTAARSDAELDAWLHGSWDIIAGGMFDDLWNPGVHVVPPFPLSKIPKGWKIDRTYDHGQSKPFSVGWYAESNGEPVLHDGHWYGPVPGDVFRIAEWYGMGREPNEGLYMLSSSIADGIKDREDDWGIHRRVRPGPADSSAWTPYDGLKSVMSDFELRGVKFQAADRGPGSREIGWQVCREFLDGSSPGSDGTRDKPGFFVFNTCRDFIRTVPVLPRDINRNADDVDTDAEDHIADEWRYRLRAKVIEVRSGRMK